jgi:hypothetical protein
VFAAAEKQALRPLPADLFVLVTWPKARIGPDIHARVGKVLYSVPWRHIGETADVRVTDTMVQFFIGGQLVKTHPRKGWGKQTDFGDYLSEDRVPNADPDVVPPPGRRDRPGVRAGHRRTARRQCADVTSCDFMIMCAEIRACRRDSGARSYRRLPD